MQTYKVVTNLHPRFISETKKKLSRSIVHVNKKNYPKGLFFKNKFLEKVIDIKKCSCYIKITDEMNSK